jgi:protein O-mannosyl-transferase
MKVISTKSFKHTIKDIHKNADNRKFCFVIGAGASRKSGIPTGGEMADKWFSEICDRLDSVELTEWMEEQQINKNYLSASYGSIYRKRFENDKTSGYEFLVQAMKSAKPSFGYIVLAQILSRSSGHCVVTTNFDSLVESSVYQFTDKTPLVCGHESLSGYARPSQTHPLIIKIHRDLLLSPKSDPSEISTLDVGWKQPLDHIFSTHIPIIIGYGGNDGSMMNYLENMNKPSNFFWCGLDENGLGDRIKLLIDKHDGNFVKINGFDDLMYSLLWAFDEIKPIRDVLKDISSERIVIADEQLEEITKPQLNEKNTEKTTEELKKEADDLSALEYSDLANKEPDLEKRKEIYVKALEKYPSTDWLWWQFTYFLHFIKKEYGELDIYYRKALELNSDQAGFLCNYAIYYETIKKDITKAQEYYLKSLSIDPANLLSLSNYALFLYNVKKDNYNAEIYYNKALKLNVIDINLFVSYADFLMNVKKDYEKAELYYLKSLSINENDFYANLNYAILLDSIKKEYTNAERYYLKALSLDGNNAIANSSYAEYLKVAKKDFINAEVYYKNALALDPDSYLITSNYGFFLETAKQDYKGAEEYYLKALALNPNDSYTNGNYAYLLMMINKDYDKAESHYVKSLTLNSNDFVVNVNYAYFLKNIKKDLAGAEKHLLKAIELKPEDGNSNCIYAQILLEKGKKEETEKHLQIAFNESVENDLLLEIWFYRYAHYPELFKEAEQKIENLLAKGIRSIDWDFDGNITQAIKEGHPNADKLKEFAKRITNK